MSYAVELTRSAARELGRVAEPYHSAITGALRGLERDPRPDGCKKLSGTKNLYRIRIGPHRAVEVTDKIKLVSVERIAHRKDAYR